MSSSRTTRRWLVLMVGLMLGGCASKLPPRLQNEVPGAPTQGAVKAEPSRYLGQTVRWGGEILRVHNTRSTTDVEIFGRPLFNNAEPRPDGGGGVRFIARVDRFLDPAEYHPGKRMTVYGRLADPVTRLIGEFDYRYPVVAVEEFALWPVYRPAPEPAWFRDPWYDPWWPWGPWGHWGPFRRYPYYWY